MAHTFYHLRPNKYVDRYLFLNTLERMEPLLHIKDYRYVGFGSYYFDDYKLMHERLHISTMVSLESDANTYKRAQDNVPYKCIQVLNQTSTDYISNSEWDEQKNIVWLDYTSPKHIARQFGDIATLMNKTTAHDIIRITLNANANTLVEGGDDVLKKRMDRFISRMTDYLPADYSEKDFNMDTYPFLLLKCLRSLIADAFVANEYDTTYFFPLFSTIYQDGDHRMLTFTGIVLDKNDNVDEIRTLFTDMSYVNCEWDKPSIIRIPALTVKEIININALLPNNGAEEQINEMYDYIFQGNKEEISSYISFYKYYPCFQSVNF